MNAANGTIRSWWALKLTYGLLFVVAGADKFINFITYWPKYISPIVANMLPLALDHAVMGVAIFEILLGAAILIKFTRLGGYVSALWLTLIALNLIMLGGVLDVAVRDLVMAVGALALAWLTSVVE